MSDVVLRVRDLVTHFETSSGLIKAVDGVSFDVHKGQVLGLVGESGSGKSVTGFSILGLIDPPGRIVSGSIELNGQELVGLSEEAMRQKRGKALAMIFQDPMMTLNPVLRIDTQMVEAIQAHEKVSKQAALARAREALVRVGIPSPDERLRAYPHQFSGGMRQRVAIAIALLNRPALIVADEPTTALDVTIQAQILELLRTMRDRSGMALLLITHDLGVVAEMASRVLVMYAGEVVEEAPVALLFAAPGHPYTEGLLAAVPTLDTSRERLHTIPGTVPPPTDWPAGCRFRDRCAHAWDRCATDAPPLVQCGPAHRVRCHLVQEPERRRT
jgi:peptide/nickel transport system ATP-binding protein